MSRLKVYPDTQPENIILDTTEGDKIAEALNAINVRFERWETQGILPEGANDEDVMKAYSTDIERLQTENGYESVDVIRLSSDHPDKDALRQKFLNEHTHSEDEVRFFVEGGGAFYLRVDGNVYMMECARGDLMSVPTGTKHWFDMGPDPHLTCIRMFTSTQGWVADFTGDTIAEKFPKFKNQTKNNEKAA